MADRELNTILNSGEITQMHLGGTSGADKVVKQEVLDLVVTDVTTNTNGIAGIVDGTQAIEKTLYADKTGAEPAYLAGNVYYSDGGLNVQNGFADVILQVGRELHIEVINTSGAQIDNGKACKQAGVTASKIKIELALADTFINATVLGIATHDIPDGESGILSIFGIVRGIDTSAFTVGVPLFLSDTVPGDFTETAPVIRTQLGETVVQDATTGQLFVNIVSNTPLPRTLGSLLDATAPTSMPADLINATPISLWTNKIEIVTLANITTGVITIPLDGTYRLNISLHMFFDNVAGAGKKEFDVDLRDVTDNVLIKNIKGFILKDAETYDFTDNGAVSLLANHEYRLELRSEIALTNFAFSSSSYYLESILY